MRTPSSTYRLQLTATFTLDQAASIVPYLRQLGISDVYLSPVLEAQPGSTHGYDVTDPSAVRAEIGGEAAFAALVARLRAAGMGLLLDIVPNHMAATPDNPWWRDVLEFGADSPHVAWFDLVPSAASGGRIDLPLLGAEPDELLERGEISLAADRAGLAIRYHEHCIPLTPASYPLALGLDQHDRDRGLAAAPPEARQALARLLRLPAVQPPGAAPDPRRRDAARAARDEFSAAHRSSPTLHAWVSERLAASDPARPGLPERLRDVLDAQAWRLRWWREATREISYRRFFDITRLVGVRVEDPKVFEATHARLCTWVAAQEVTGLRVDHIDGLLDPAAYLRRLRDRAPTYTVVEKILARDETLRADWAAEGTTGYDFLNVVNGWFVEPAGWRRLVEAYARATGVTSSFREIAYERKRRVLDQLFGGEMAALMRELLALLARLPAATATGPAPAGPARAPAASLERVLRAVTATLEVYRTYVTREGVAPEDRRLIEEAFARAGERLTTVDGPALALLRGVLLLDPGAIGDARDDAVRFTMQWQQLTGPVMAKGFEDTALYAYSPLASINEVGGDPGDPLTSTDRLHAFLSARARSTPATMNATATHDTKRGEDLRARLHVLSELPDEWDEMLAAWAARDTFELPGAYRGEAKASANDDILLLQTLIGTWPLASPPDHAYAARLREYVLKAAREANERTAWRDPVPAYEAAVERRVDDWLFSERGAPLRDRVARLVERVAFAGALNSLAQVALKATAPGVPDFYQGTELWSFALVDPDNRRPVDFDHRQALLNGLTAALDHPAPAIVSELLRAWTDGRIKLFVTSAALRHRRALHELFESGAYLEVPVSGRSAAHLVAFARTAGTRWSVTLAARWLTGRLDRRLAEDDAAAWEGTILRFPNAAPRTWRSVFTGETLQCEEDGSLRAGAALGPLPCAILYAGD